MSKIITLCGILGAIAMQANAAGLTGFSLPANAAEIKKSIAESSLPAPVAAAAATPDGLNDQNKPEDPLIKLGMYGNLQKAGIDMPLTDVRELIKPGAEKTLLKHSFALQPGAGGAAIYTLGNAQLYDTGQRAVINKDGSASLVCFSQTAGGHPILELITINAAGKISNSVTMLP